MHGFLFLFLKNNLILIRKLIESQWLMRHQYMCHPTWPTLLTPIFLVVRFWLLDHRISSYLISLVLVGKFLSRSGCDTWLQQAWRHIFCVMLLGLWIVVQPSSHTNLRPISHFWQWLLNGYPRPTVHTVSGRPEGLITRPQTSNKETTVLTGRVTDRDEVGLTKLWSADLPQTQEAHPNIFVEWKQLAKLASYAHS